MPSNATTRQFEILMAVAECGGFAPAAKALNISQAAVSKQINSLECNVGFQVFQRKRGSRPVLTPRGKSLIATLPHLLEDLHSVTTPSRPHKSAAAPVRVACGDDTAELISEHLHLFYAEVRHIAVEIIPTQPAMSSITQLDKDNIDLAYLTTRPPLSPRIGEHIATFESNLYISGRPDSLMQWTPEQVLPFISDNTGTFLDDAFERHLRSAGVAHFEVVARLPTSIGRINLALAGIGAICAWKTLVQAYLADGRLQPLALPPIVLYRYCCRNQKRMHDPDVRRVDAFLTRILS